jgi:hypothetical protein
MVICGDFVVKTWWERGVDSASKNTPTFEYLFFGRVRGWPLMRVRSFSRCAPEAGTSDGEMRGSITPFRMTTKLGQMQTQIPCGDDN